ncbi:acetyltransferase [Vibrio zhanjiangensis]|uniref:Acetyltransferase n=1 Tax=Vibrio zhanjiangensis TaxID=1046128 RepID=A0ABQ6ET57_9VIBR|nr:DHH family phosphoesterase [Vibrio zhanjiangensis]GLT16328.1 acetyltransferase [Vibrio zhanjiangensis]
MHYDVFNGDADGILSLLQLRLAEPKQSTLVTGLKRDIKLLETLDCQSGDTLTVLDISMRSNMAGLKRVLASGAYVFYADHHQAGDIPQEVTLDAHIDLDANICTALIIDRLLGGKFHHWAIVAAFGDNLFAKAEALALACGLTQKETAQLNELGSLINYNGYGETLADLNFAPDELYLRLLNYDDPFAVIRDPGSPYPVLRASYEQDMNQVLAIEPLYLSNYIALFELPDKASSRRISGVYGNWLANQSPDLAHAVLTKNHDGSYKVSLRAPINHKHGAGELCSQFISGGGREASGGINTLDRDMLPDFLSKVENYYRQFIDAAY